MPSRERLRDGVFLLLASALLIYALLGVPYVGTHDGPNHLTNCVLENRFDDPQYGLDRWFERGSPITNLGYQILCRPLESAFGWRWALRGSMVVITLLWSLGFYYLGRALFPRSAVVFLGFATALAWPFYMGFFDFLMAEAMVLWVIGFVIRHPEPGRFQWLMIGVAATLVAITHVFPAALLGVALGLLILWSKPRERWLAFLWRLALAMLPAGAIAVSSSGGTDQPTANTWHDLATRFVDLSQTFLGGPSWRAILGATLGVLGLIVGWARLRTLPREARAVLSFATLLALAGFLCPFHLSTWALFSPRFWLLALSLPMLMLGAIQLMDGVVGVAAVAGVVGASLGWSVAHHQTQYPALAEVLAGLEAPVKRNGARMPLIMGRVASPIAHAEPEVMLGHLYVLEQGGVDPYVYADVPLIDGLVWKDSVKVLFGPHPMRFARESLKCAGLTPECPTRAQQIEIYTMLGRNFEDVILFEDEPDVSATFLRAGYTAEFQKGRLSLMRPPPAQR